MFVSLFLLVALGQIPDAPTPKPASPPPSSSAGRSFPAAAGASTTSASTARPRELLGDKLGESPETFIAQHPKAQCDTSQKPRVTCYQWTGVSLYGSSANAGPTCSLKKRYAADCLQGLSAHFAEQGLTSIAYIVGGIDRTAITEGLRKEFGSAGRDSREGTVWNMGNATASVLIGKMGDSPDEPTLITVTLTAAN